MKLLFVILGCLLLHSVLHAQGLQELRALSGGGTGDDVANAVAVDNRSNVYVAGSFKGTSFAIGNFSLSNAGSNTTDAFLAKLDTSGNVVWAKRFGGTGSEEITAVKTDANGAIYAVGTGFPLTKFDSTGNIAWQQTAGAAPFTTIAIDSKGNIYTGNYTGFQKYRSDGTFVYSKTVPYYNMAGDFSLDWFDNAHIFFHANGGTIVNGTQSYNVNLATKVVYDTAGQIISVNQLSTNPRWFPVGYKAIRPDDYYATASYPTLSPTYNMGLGRNITGNNWSYSSCLQEMPVNPVTDGFGSEFYAGNLQYGITCPGVPPVVLQISPTNQINSLTGGDIFFIQRTATKDTGSTTYGNGRTNESAVRTAVDSIRGLFYIVGRWSKIADTAKFRFGGSVLTNAGNGTTTDALLLTLRYANVRLTVNAGFDQTICAGGSVQLSAGVSGGAGNYTYSWTPATGLNNATAPNPVAKPTASTTYRLTVTDASGGTASDTVRITINPALYKPAVPITLQTNPFCEGQAIVLISEVATSYQWNARTVTTGLNNGTLSISQSDTVTVTTVNSQGCIGTSDAFIAVMKPRTPMPTIIPTGNAQNVVVACVGNTVSLTAQNVQSPVSYTWNTGTVTPSVNTQTSGMYSVTAKGPNGCPSLATSRNVQFFNLPAGNITSASSTNLCAGDSTQLTVNTADSVSVLWNTGASSKSIWVKTAGVYTAQLTTSQGCTRPASNSIMLSVNPRPVPVLTQNGNTLSVSPAGASYQWYLNDAAVAGATSQSLNITVGGNYKAVVTDANGCTGSALLGAVLRIANPVLTYLVYPNPAKDKVTIVYSLPQSEKVSIFIRNEMGQRIYAVVDNKQQASGDYQYVVNTSLLAKGLLFVEFKIGDKSVVHKQLVVPK